MHIYILNNTPFYIVKETSRKLLTLYTFFVYNYNLNSNTPCIQVIEWEFAPGFVLYMNVKIKDSMRKKKSKCVIKSISYLIIIIY